MVQVVVPAPVRCCNATFPDEWFGIRIADLEACLQSRNLWFSFQRERGDIHRHLCVDRTGVVLLPLHSAQDVRCRRFDAADKAGASGSVGKNVAGLAKAWLRHDAAGSSRPADLADLHPGAVVMQRLSLTVFDFTLVLVVFHVDEVVTISPRSRRLNWRTISSAASR